ncbi:MAG: phosphatidylserine decarboxylase family protein [Ignavibacteria bacterium]|nr:phosphatidylserine decarboxylase family protein [Ignavibacteria bacterium]
MSITKYGYGTITVVAVICLILVVAGIYSPLVIIRYGLFVLAGFLLVFTLNFFRDPERTIPAGENNVISPCDGKVIIIKEVEEDRYIKGKARQISVFMSPLNVHVNRIPVDGTVEYLKYVPGKYLPAFEDKASTENERSEIGLQSKFGKVFFTQVAGYVARRIIFELKEGQAVKRGDRFGMIRFGSRVDIIVPLSWKVQVKLGDMITAGESILFICE